MAMLINQPSGRGENPADFVLLSIRGNIG